jgi:hypothetical protein
MSFWFDRKKFLINIKFVGIGINITENQDTAVLIGVNLSCQRTKSVSHPTSPTGVSTPAGLLVVP